MKVSSLRSDQGPWVLVHNYSRSIGYKKFSAAELKERRKQGLCYYCVEKYNPSHNCKAQCYALLCREDLDALIEEESEEPSHKEESSLAPEISFNAFRRDYYPSTSRLKGVC